MNFTELIRTALEKAGKQDVLATTLDLSPSDLSKRINGTTGWQEKDINLLLEFTGMNIMDGIAEKKKIATLKETIKIFMEECE
jgi:hypothetical protein